MIKESNQFQSNLISNSHRLQTQPKQYQNSRNSAIAALAQPQEIQQNTINYQKLSESKSLNYNPLQQQQQNENDYQYSNLLAQKTPPQNNTLKNLGFIPNNNNIFGFNLLSAQHPYRNQRKTLNSEQSKTKRLHTQQELYNIQKQIAYDQFSSNLQSCLSTKQMQGKEQPEVKPQSVRVQQSLSLQKIRRQYTFLPKIDKPKQQTPRQTIEAKQQTIIPQVIEKKEQSIQKQKPKAKRRSIKTVKKKKKSKSKENQEQQGFKAEKQIETQNEDPESDYDIIQVDF